MHHNYTTPEVAAQMSSPVQQAYLAHLKTLLLSICASWQHPYTRHCASRSGVSEGYYYLFLDHRKVHSLHQGLPAALSESGSMD